MAARPSYSRLHWAVLWFGIFFVVVLVISMMCHGNGLVALQSYVLLHNMISMSAGIYITSVVQGDRVYESYPYCFGLHRLPALVRFSNLIFLLGGCGKQLGEVGHHLSERHVDTNRLQPHEQSNPGLFHGVAEASPVVLALIHMLLTICFWEPLWNHDVLVGRPSEGMGWRECRAGLLLAEKGSMGIIDTLGGVSGGYKLKRHLIAAFHSCRLMSAPIAILISCLLQQCWPHWCITELCSFVCCAALILRACMIGWPLAQLLLNTNIQPSRGMQEGFNMALHTISTMEGVVDVVHWAWWRVHEHQTVVFLQLRIMVDADAARLAAQCRNLLVQRNICSQAFIECEVSGNSIHDTLLDLPHTEAVPTFRMDKEFPPSPSMHKSLSRTEEAIMDTLPALRSPSGGSSFLPYNMPSPMSAEIAALASHSCSDHHHHHSHGHSHGFG